MKKAGLFTFIIFSALLLCITASAKNFEKNASYSGQFTDVAKDAWYAGNVKDVYELGLMKGTSDNSFSPKNEMSVAEALTLATRLHSIYNNTTVPASTKAGARWFDTYADYCIANGIISKNQFDKYDRPVLSFEMVQIFAACLPKNFYSAKNTVKNVPDVPENLIFADDVLLFYNAGILNGNDSKGTFLPMSTITRMRASAIISRIALPENRISFSIPDIKKEYSVSEVYAMLDAQTVKETLDNIELIKTDSGYSVTAAEYRYCSFVSDGDDKETEKAIRNSAALYSLAKKNGVKIPYSTVSNIYSSYYSVRYQKYGENLTYFDALASQNLSDSVFTKMIINNELTPLIVTKNFSVISPEKVFEYAKNNNYICADHILIQSSTENAYETALKILLSIKDGEDFDKLKKQYCQDPAMFARNGGYYFTKGVMVPEFERRHMLLKKEK